METGPLENSNHNPEFEDSESIEIAQVANEDTRKQNSKKLLEELRGLDLTPEQTRDDISNSQSRDEDILGDVPPHHGAS